MAAYVRRRVEHLHEALGLGRPECPQKSDIVRQIPWRRAATAPPPADAGRSWGRMASPWFSIEGGAVYGRGVSGNREVCGKARSFSEQTHAPAIRCRSLSGKVAIVSDRNLAPYIDNRPPLRRVVPIQTETSPFSQRSPLGVEAVGKASPRFAIWSRIR